MEATTGKEELVRLYIRNLQQRHRITQSLQVAIAGATVITKSGCYVGVSHQPLHLGNAFAADEHFVDESPAQVAGRK